MLAIIFITVTAGNATVPVDQRLIGTWKCVEGRTWIFKADGTGSVDGADFRFTSFTNKIVTYVKATTNVFPVRTMVSDYIVSTNSRTCILYNPLGAVWLERRN
ncbi:MAG: hypothetical protein FWE57_06445 [Chitinispirillia bacterium]|nr:hypothetical protein [Chitinispirillia bacterium]